jgi:hypothetical protein
MKWRFYLPSNIILAVGFIVIPFLKLKYFSLLLFVKNYAEILIYIMFSGLHWCQFFVFLFKTSNRNSFIYLFFSGRIEELTQSLIVASQEFYHLTHFTSPFMYWVYFFALKGRESNFIKVNTTVLFLFVVRILDQEVLSPFFPTC